MVKSKLIAVGATLGIAMLVATPVFACHPQGTIVKKVQDVTTSSAMVDADSVSSALTVNSGDTLTYEITIGNKGANGSVNAMVNTVLKDTLPAGIVLVSGGNTINENLGTIQPGKTVTKQYAVKVTSQKDGDVITNKACFTGDSTDHRVPQSGCDTAVVKVHVPETPVTPVTPVTPTTPETPVQPQLPAQLPSTGPEAFVGTALGLGAITYAIVYLVRNKRRLISPVLSK